MQKVKIRLPATLTDFGAAFQNLGLAIALYTHVDISPRIDEQLIVETSGEGAGQYAIGLRHPVVLAMMRVFQQLELAPPGIQIRILNDIPLASGLGAETAFMVAGVIAANNLMGNRFNRKEMIELAAQVSGQPDNAITAILGGLTASLQSEEGLIYRTLPLQPFKLIVAIPSVSNYQSPALADRITAADTLQTLKRLPLMLEALREGNIRLLAQVFSTGLLRADIMGRIPGYAHVAEVARLAGALAVTTSGGGPAMIFLAEKGHDRIAEVIETAFKNVAAPAKIYVLPMDTQGVVMSMMQTTQA